MAGNKLNTKTKGKEDKSKVLNSKGQTSEETEEPDFALLRKPIVTSVTGFGQARKIFDLATEELKDILSNECDLLYECKVCRNIFRSLANFISHKRVYCKEKFNSSMHSHFIKAASTVNEIIKIKNLERGYQESLKESKQMDNNDLDEIDDRIPLTKDLTAIMEKIAQNKGVSENHCDDPQIALQKIPNSTVAVFQNVQICEDKSKENMRAQVNELDNILSRDIAVLQSDGQFKIQSSVAVETDSVIQISDDDETDRTNILKCKICEMQFSTQKTLKFHMKYKHVESRLVYPCPDCLEIFSTSWSVYRHLFKVHRKTAAQIRRLRESIQAKAFKMNNPPAFYEKRKNNLKTTAAQKITEEERMEQENQAWMDNMEGDGELPRCGGCGRTFERRAALAAHTHTCQPRSRALARRPQETKKIEIQIRKDYNKGPPMNLNLPLKTTDANENKLPKEEPQIPIKPSKDEEKSVVEEEKEDEDDAMDVSEDEQKSNDATQRSPEPELELPQIEPPKLSIKLPFAHQAEKSNLTAFRQRILSEIEGNKLLCKRCDSQFNDTQELYDHVAEHIKWLRYACKLCNYKHFSFEKLPEHVKVVHKLRGDKDFYYSTVKAIDGTEALELCESTDELPDANETSPDSRRPSRCSSDSSRLSDDSSSSSTRIEGLTRKRKIYQSKNSTKRRKEFVIKASQEKDGDISLDKSTSPVENYTSSNMKNFEENSSDFDDVDAKKQISSDVTSSVASRRPVRRKTKPKNEDFEYDLSNLLKMEAQGYRDSQSLANAKTTQTKKKTQIEIQINYDNVNKDCCGALISMSKKSVERAGAHMKTSFTNVYPQKDNRTQNVFVRPMLPKILARGDKISPKKETNEDVKKECSSPSKEILSNKIHSEDVVKNKIESNTEIVEKTTSTNENEIVKPKSIPSVLPLKFRRQSIELIKNPIINKNISDFTKAGMKTKILVIKPINRNKDGTQTFNNPLKFQTIKLKDPNKNPSSKEDKDQVMVVKVPKVDCAVSRPVTEVPNKSNEIVSSVSDCAVARTVTEVPKKSSEIVSSVSDCGVPKTVTEVPNKSNEIVSSVSDIMVARPVTEVPNKSNEIVSSVSVDTPNETASAICTVEENEVKFTLPSCAPSSSEANEPTDVQEDTSNENEKIIQHEINNVYSVAVKDEIEESLIVKDISAMLNTTV